MIYSGDEIGHVRARHIEMASRFFVQFLNCVWLFATPWTAACRASLSFTISWSLFKFPSIESVMHFAPYLPWSAGTGLGLVLIETGAGCVYQGNLEKSFRKKKRIRSILASWLFLMVISIPMNTHRKEFDWFLECSKHTCFCHSTQGP